MNKKEFAEKFDAATPPSDGKLADRYCSFLRGYAATINDSTFEEIADFIDDLLGRLHEASESALCVEEEPPRAPESLSKEETLKLVRAAALAASKPKPFGPNIPRGL